MSAHYDGLSIALHWLLAAAVLAMVAVGVWMAELPFSPLRLKLINWHKWAGIVVLALTLVRLAWMLWRPAPPARPPMPRWQARAAGAVHAGLLALCIVLPLVGWAHSSAAGFPVVLFALWPLPDWVAPDRALAETLKGVHEALAWALSALVLLHGAAALKHQFVDRDGLLARMAPGRRTAR